MPAAAVCCSTTRRVLGDYRQGANGQNSTPYPLHKLQAKDRPGGPVAQAGGTRLSPPRSQSRLNSKWTRVSKIDYVRPFVVIEDISEGESEIKTQGGGNKSKAQAEGERSPCPRSRRGGEHATGSRCGMHI